MATSEQRNAGVPEAGAEARGAGPGDREGPQAERPKPAKSQDREALLSGKGALRG